MSEKSYSECVGSGIGICRRLIAPNGTERYVWHAGETLALCYDQPPHGGLLVVRDRAEREDVITEAFAQTSGRCIDLVFAPRAPGGTQVNFDLVTLNAQQGDPTGAGVRFSRNANGDTLSFYPPSSCAERSWVEWRFSYNSPGVNLSVRVRRIP